MLMSLVGGIGYTSVLSSLHQFITNGISKDTQVAAAQQSFQPGLGKSEFFYSWTITVYSIGEVVFAPIAGYATVWIPYWYILMVGVLAHTFGYLIYSFSTSGGMILLSRLLTGAYGGIIETIAYSYISERQSNYEAVYNKVHEANMSNQMESKPLRVKERTYAFLTVIITLSYIIGPGMSAVIAQFPQVNQFLWVGYFNVALGAIAFLCLFLFFHGEYNSKCCPSHSENIERENETPVKLFKKYSLSRKRLLKLSILLFFIIVSYVTDSSYAVVDTLFNPILSDCFGFTEKETSYYFIGVMLVYVIGSLLLVLFSLLRSNNRLVIIFSLFGSICGSALIADWQSIGNDSCRQYSNVFQGNVTTMFSDSQLNLTERDYSPDPLESCIQLNFTSTGLSNESLMDLIDVAPPSGYEQLYSDTSISCKYSKDKYIPHCVDFDSLKWNTSLTNFSILSSKVTTKALCAEFSLTIERNLKSKMSHTAMECSISQNYASLCVDALNIDFFKASEISSFKNDVILVTKIILGQSVVINSRELNDLLINDDVNDYGSAELSQSEICLSHDKCQWNQFSSISNSICYGCPGICRNDSHSQSFIQFSFGVILFVLSVPVSRVILMVLISDNIDKNEQGPFTGIVVAVGGIARAVAPIWIDATYELMGKRSFLVMCIKLAAYLVVLIGFILMYKNLQPANNSENSNLENSNPEKGYNSEYSDSDDLDEYESLKLIERTH